MRYIDLTSPDINNGLGCRATLWIAGCIHKCKGCQNQHTWSFNQGQELYSEDGGKRILERVYNELNKPYIQGLTISGGDPFAGQTKKSLHELWKFLTSIKTLYPDKDVWLFTGDIYEDDIKDNPLKMDVFKLCDVVVDGPFIKEQKDLSLAFRGSKNQRLIDVKKTLEHGKVVELNIED